MLVVWPVEEIAWDATGLVEVTLRSLSDEDGFTEVLELGEDCAGGLDVVGTDVGAQPLHLQHKLLNVGPVVAHQRASAVTEVGVQIDIGSVGSREGTGGNKGRLVSN